MDRGIGVASLDQRTDRRRRGVEDADLAVLDDLPEPAGIRVGRHALKDDFGGATGEDVYKRQALSCKAM